MAQSLAKVYLHVVFSTKARQPWLKNADLRRETHRLIAEVCRRLGSPAIEVGGVSDHVHVLCTLARTLTIAELVKEMKRTSSLWVKDASENCSFYWQDGYGAFSVSPGHVEAVRHYIRYQESHHREESFQDEFRRLLDKYDVEYDERYVWE